MVGSDAAVAYVDGQLGFVDDYNITARSACGGVVGVKRGVCRDDLVGGNPSNNQFQRFSRNNYYIQVLVEMRRYGLRGVWSGSRARVDIRGV